MKLIRTQDAVGQVLCHDITQIIPGITKDAVFRKGHIIREEDIPILLSVGKEHIYIFVCSGFKPPYYYIVTFIKRISYYLFIFIKPVRYISLFQYFHLFQTYVWL